LDNPTKNNMNTPTTTPFLRQTADYIAKATDFNPLKTCIIFPSRRSASVFRKEWMLQNKDQTQFLPQLLTISDFAREKSGLTVPDKDILLMKLFEAYGKEGGPAQDFQGFMFWGQMMLSDFDEIDKYCVDGAKLYSIIRDEQLIEAQFSIEEDLKELLKNFWSAVKEEPRFERDFLESWKLLGRVYQTYRQQLLAEGLAYEGLAYRQLQAKLESKQIHLPYENIHFVGFNALTTVEERLINVLSDQYQVHLFWDTDHYFTEQVPSHEAGHFLRQYKHDFKLARQHWTNNRLLNRERNFNFHGAPLLQGQIQVAKALLETPFEGSTVVVLCDEGMLEPLLHILPKTDQLNITIGKPVGRSPLADFLDIIYQIVSVEKVYRRNLERLSVHFCYLQLAGQHKAKAFYEQLQKSGSFWFKADQILSKSGLPESVLRTADNMQGVIAVWLELLSLLQENSRAEEHPGLQETIAAFSDALKTALPFLDTYGHLLSMEAAHLMVWQKIKAMTIPFLTDNSSSTQVMGFLETRLMDYDRVIILGANEDLLPASRKSNSYIPYNLRRIFGLPTLQEFDGVYAYHFFRLLQRSREAHLIYNDTPGDNTSFEKSRFLEQILLELDTPENNITRKQWTYPAHELKTEFLPLEIQKTKEHVALLEGFQFSQSALSTYLICPVQFYLTYIAKLQEPDVLEEIMDAGTFGTVLHDTIEGMYSGLINRVLRKEDFLATKPRIDQHLEVAFGKSSISYEELKGENLLAHDVIRAAVLKLVDADAWLAEQEPFMIKGLEEKRTMDISVPKGDTSITMQLSGKIDRIDAIPQADGSELIRILDYKTGKLDFKTDESITGESIFNMFNRHQIKPKKQIFQGLFYQLLLGDVPAQIGFYGMRALSQGIQYIHRGKPVDPVLRKTFEENVAQLLSEIIHPDVPFQQNPHPDAYEYSPYSFLVG
jgi:hypothetical protein